MAFIQLLIFSISILSYLFIFKRNFFIKIKTNYLKVFIIFLIASSFLLIYNQNYKNNRFYSLYVNILDFDYKNLSNNNHFNTSYTNYVYNFASALKTFNLSPYYGNGYRDYNVNCKDKLKGSYLSVGCSTHPHNITLEVLTDHGIIGVILFYNFIFYLIFKNFNSRDKNYGFYISFLILNFPLFTSQSIFSSYFGSIYFLILYINYYIYLKNLK